MKKEFESIIKSVKKIKLSDEERANMRVNLLEKLNTSQNQYVTNSKNSRLHEYYQDIKEYYYMFKKNKFVPVLIIALLVVFTGGTSAFAEKAIPGDLLYGVKVHVNEPTAGIFALSKTDKTKWTERLVERRLDEAQKLVSRDDLDESKRLDLEVEINSQIDEFNTNIDKLALENGESINSSDLNIRLQASLRAYQSVLEKLSENEETSEDTKQETKKLLSSLKQSRNRVEDDHDDLELNIGVGLQNNSSASTSPANSGLANAKQNASSNILSSVKLSYQREKVNLSLNIQNQINNKLALAESALEEGITFANSNDYSNAISKFQLVINSANEAKLLIFSNVIKGDIDDDMGIDDNDGDIDEDVNINEGIHDDEEDIDEDMGIDDGEDDIDEDVGFDDSDDDSDDDEVDDDRGGNRSDLSKTKSVEVDGDELDFDEFDEED